MARGRAFYSCSALLYGHELQDSAGTSAWEFPGPHGARKWRPLHGLLLPSLLVTGVRAALSHGFNLHAAWITRHRRPRIVGGGPSLQRPYDYPGHPRCYSTLSGSALYGASLGHDGFLRVSPWYSILRYRAKDIAGVSTSNGRMANGVGSHHQPLLYPSPPASLGEHMHVDNEYRCRNLLDGRNMRSPRSSSSNPSFPATLTHTAVWKSLRLVYLSLLLPPIPLLGTDLSRHPVPIVSIASGVESSSSERNNSLSRLSIATSSHLFSYLMRREPLRVCGDRQGPQLPRWRI